MYLSVRLVACEPTDGVASQSVSFHLELKGIADIFNCKRIPVLDGCFNISLPHFVCFIYGVYFMAIFLLC